VSGVLTPLAIVREDTLSVDNAGWQQSEKYYIQVYASIVTSGLLANVDGTGLKILIALGPAASITAGTGLT
jgi:hypothetical protein